MGRATKKVAEKVLGGPTKPVSKPGKKVVPVKETKKTVKKAAKDEVTLLPIPKKLEVPKELAKAADLLYSVQQHRLKKQNELKPLAEFETELREHLIRNLPRSQANGIAGKIARVTRREKEVPQLDDEEKFLKYASRKGNEDLISKKPNMKAVEERWEAKKEVPGIKAFKVITISLNKL